MDVESYDSLLLRTKGYLEDRKIFTAAHFSSSLGECKSCISLCLELVTKLLKETNKQNTQICGYIEDAITLLQMLSDFIKNVIESAAMSCSNMKPFPITTGHIILTVFMHCKDSECLYGNKLKFVEMQLKDLFRTCHELQLTYLMTMEKHFTFDLTEKEEQEVLLESLNINLRIAEIVKALDIKTMAEQWKAYTVLCEKYSSFLQDRNIYNKCIQLCAHTVIDNIKTAIELAQDNKNILRSLKVANFTMKIILRISNIFKQATTNNYAHVVDLLFYIYLHHPAYLDLAEGKSSEFINLVISNILNPTDSLCSILLQDENFISCLYKIDETNLETDTLLGYIVLIIHLMKAMLQVNDDDVANLAKGKLIDCVYRILRKGHYWFNMGLKFQSKDSNGSGIYFSLYEHLLVHTVAFASTFNLEQYAALERHMYEAILSTDCYRALFSSNLWTLLTRISSDQLVMITLSSLISVYQKLEKHESFHNSPQEVHISYTIGKFFEILSAEDKRQISQQCHPQNNLWCVLKVQHLPDRLRRRTEAIVIENMKTSFNECFESLDAAEEEIMNLIQNMKTTATCSSENNDVIEQYVLKLWSKACHKREYIRAEDLFVVQTVWYFEYLEALLSLTEHISYRLANSSNSGKILHNISTIMHSCNTEIIVLLFPLFCTITFNQSVDENQHVIALFSDTLTFIERGTDACLKAHILKTLSSYRDHEQFQELTSMFHEDELLENNVEKKFNNPIWKRKLLEAARNEFTHKCMRSKSSTSAIEPERAAKNTKSNFDLGDFLFEDDSSSVEPLRKKAKLESIEPDNLIESLENDTSLLCQVEHAALSDDSKKRIKNVMNKLSMLLR